MEDVDSKAHDQPGRGDGRVTDHALVERARGGDRRAFDLLVMRYTDRIFSLCYSKLGSTEDASDATQEVFLRAYRALGRFEGKSQFYTWLFRIAINCSFTRRKKRGRELALGSTSLEQAPLNDEGDGFEPADVREQPEASALRAEQRRIIHDAIASLPDGFREIVELRDLQGLAYEEIAEILEVPIGSVKSRLHRARLQLRTKLERYLGESDLLSRLPAAARSDT